MATAYAALVSLINVLNRVQDSTCPVKFEKTQIHSLTYKVSGLVDFFEANSRTISKDLERKITDAAYAAEDKIETCVVSKIHARGSGSKLDQLSGELSIRKRSGFLNQDLEKNIQEMDVIIQEATKVEQEKGVNDKLPRSTVHLGLSMPPSGTIKIVGFEEEVNLLLEQLATNRSGREIVPIVGMGGIGKSTLAASVYNLPYVRDYFHVKAWVTISHVYDAGTIIRPLLHDFGVSGVGEVCEEKLGDELHKYLFGRKYLIVLDDIWDIEAWEGIRRFFPDNNNGSRVLLTTRLLNVAHSVGSCSPYEMQLLDDEKSWDLLSKKVFGDEVFPHELENCGKQIAKGCKGLPLALVVIGGMLKMSDSTLEYWAYVAENVSSIISREDDDHCLRILSLSYHELPIHLSPCFLYMATFPEDYEIKVSEIIMLWAADGLLKPSVDDTLEKVALENLKNLISRNLIMVKKLDSRGHMKCLIVHDLVRGLCLREAHKQRFLYVDDGAGSEESQHRFVLHRPGCISFPTTEQKRLARSYISLVRWTSTAYMPPDMPFLSLLRVIFARTPKYIRQLTNLRFIKSSDENLFLYSSDPSDWYLGMSESLISISSMWNLETLIIEVRDLRNYSIPSEIWELRHIKHVIFSRRVRFPDPPATHTCSILSNLQTLKEVIISSNEVLSRIPNIKDLGIRQDFSKDVPAYFWTNLFHCHKLEMLDLEGSIRFAANELNVKLFPNHLKKLSLSYCRIPCERMTVIGSLPNLEVLKLKWDAFTGYKWESTEGEFQSLKLLSIVSCDVADWIVENCSHFPCLECLSLRSMWNLGEVPQVFGESMTLKSIWLKWCDASAVISAKQILDEQESIDNYELTIEVLYPLVVNKEQEAELKSLASDRFHVKLVEDIKIDDDDDELESGGDDEEESERGAKKVAFQSVESDEDGDGEIGDIDDENDNGVFHASIKDKDDEDGNGLFYTRNGDDEDDNCLFYTRDGDDEDGNGLFYTRDGEDEDGNGLFYTRDGDDEDDNGLFYFSDGDDEDDNGLFYTRDENNGGLFHSRDEGEDEDGNGLFHSRDEDEDDEDDNGLFCTRVRDGDYSRIFEAGSRLLYTRDKDDNGLFHSRHEDRDDEDDNELKRLNSILNGKNS